MKREPIERRTPSRFNGTGALPITVSLALVAAMAVFRPQGGKAFAQDRRLIEVRSANVLNVKFENDREVRELIGNVHLIQTAPEETTHIWCDSARRHMDLNRVELFGNVRIVQDGVALRAPEALYDGNERTADMPKGVELRRGSKTLTAQRGKYFGGARRADFHGNVLVVDSLSSTVSRTLVYFEDEEKSIAVGDVRVHSVENDLTVFGDSLVHFDRERYTVVPKRPRMVQIDTSSTGEIDTLLVVASVLEAFQDTLHRFIARERVAMVRTDFSAQCGEAVYYPREGRITLSDKPVVWHHENQVTGDSIEVRLVNRRLRSVFVAGRAMAVSRTDTLHRRRFDQLSGREILMEFRNDKLDRIEARRNATSLYYLFEETGPNGVNRSSGDRIIVEFVEGKTERIGIVGGVEGRYFPEPMIARREPEYNLEGFRWIELRPKRRGLEIVIEPHL